MDSSPINLNETLLKIKKAGANKVRAVPMPGQNVHTGSYQIEICEDTGWNAIAVNVPKETATNLIKQGTNRTILG